MKKQISRIIFIPFALALVLSSCQGFVDELAVLHLELLNLQEEVNRINTTTIALGDIISGMDNDMITSIDEIIEEDVCIGYSINYKNGKTIRVYHGSDGEKGPKGDDGHNGKDGHSPVISIRQGPDNIWYWTIDGNWMTDSSGNKVPVAGEEGITPMLKIEQGRWLISYDGGKSWQDYGIASASYGNSPIKDVDYTTYENKVKFTLRDGTEFYVPKAETDVRLVCNTPSRTEAKTGEIINIGLKVVGTTQSTMSVEVMAGDMFTWTVKQVRADSCSVSLRAKEYATESDLLTVFVNCGQKTWMKVFTFDLSKPETHEDLSYNGTANCYIVNKAGTYHFVATVKGNSTESLDGTPSQAEVLWESFGTNEAPSSGDLVRSASYSNGYIYFTVPEPVHTGNAGIAVLNSQGEILWSWHIWICPGFNPESTAVTLSGTVYMDRNLGAITNDPESTLSYGHYYVNGRKDPVMGPLSNSQKVVSNSDNWNYSEMDDSMHTYDYFVANPMRFNSNPYHVNLKEYYWDESKSVNDPCPPGWVIPSGFKYSSISRYKQGFLLYGNSEEEKLYLPGAGYNWFCTYSFAEYWICSPEDGYYHHFKFTDDYHQHEITSYDFYYSVRCCKQ